MQVLLMVVAVIVLVFVGVAMMQRFAPRRFSRMYWRVANPVFRALAGRVPGLVLLETTGRRTGRIHQVPVAGRAQGNVVWLVAGHASDCDYLHNLRADPQVRVRVGGRWRDGVADVVPEDDPRSRALRVNPINGSFIRLATSDLVSVRVALD